MGKPPKERIPVLRPGVDITRLRLSQEEGLVASYVDGKTHAADMAVLVGWEVPKIREILQTLHSKQVIQFRSGAWDASDDGAVDLDPYDGFVFPVPEMSEDVDLSVEEKKRILWTHAQLETWTHYELLRVRRRDDAAAVSAAFQERSLEFHPDRFRRERMGTYRKKLEEIFQRLLEAKRTLSDPKKRKAYEEEFGHLVFDPEDLSEMEREKRKEEREARRQKIDAERRKRRNPMRKKVGRAKELKQQAEELRSTGDLLGALRQAQTAELFDPRDEELKRFREEVEQEAKDQRLAPLLKRADQAFHLTRFEAAIPVLRAAIDIDPKHAESLKKLGHCLDQTHGDLTEAKALLQQSVRANANDPDTHFFLARVFMKLDSNKLAISECKRALEIKPNHQEAKKLLRKLKLGF